ncbi:MAG: DAK2 domain-containing protein [Peptococcaceae bacterium]|jgi:DAK2 domain fusion protein YloV|nr:DAK2 domain-containing protein [Peptococcaceae bacterium]
MVLEPEAVFSDEIVNGEQWKQMIRAGVQALEDRKREVDALNVFPVPDGDTGTNMFLTIQSAAKKAEEIKGTMVSEIAAAVSAGSLMGARGNSGVILSQLLRGMAKSVEGLYEVNARQLAQALQSGVDTAYKAVMKPVEGTILTVSREAAKGALLKANQGGNPVETLCEAVRRGQEALQKTPDVLPVLKQAGVVDAGGQGFLIILSGWIAALEGDIAFNIEEIPPKPPEAEGSAAGNMALDSLEYPYCTEFLLKGRDLIIEQIRKDLARRGDCLLVVGEPELVKVHIHTKNPGKILDYAMQWGTLHEIQIHNMLAQNEAMAHDRKETKEAAVAVPKEHGVVAVTMGQGIVEIFTKLGVDEVLTGGQTMNPSTEDIAEAVRRVAADNIYILPNNSNIILAALQVQELIEDKKIHVIPSKSISQGIAALLNFIPEGTVEENIEGMESALSRVQSGEVTYAVRDSQFDSLNIAAGDVLGLVEGIIVVNGRDLLSVAQNTLEKMNWRQGDLVTIFYGQDVERAEADQLEKWLKESQPQVDIEIHAGGQPIYFYIFSVE